MPVNISHRFVETFRFSITFRNVCYGLCIRSVQCFHFKKIYIMVPLFLFSYYNNFLSDSFLLFLYLIFTLLPFLINFFISFSFTFILPWASYNFIFISGMILYFLLHLFNLFDTFDFSLLFLSIDSNCFAYPTGMYQII